MKKLTLLYFNLVILVAFSCSKNENRDFFKETSKSYIDLKIGSFYFLKAFGVDNSPTKINELNYWKLNCDKISFFYCAGFLRFENNSLKVIPINSPDLEEKMLFDFNSEKGKTWSASFNIINNIEYGDSIIYIDKVINNNDTLFSYMMYPFELYKKSNRKEFLSHCFKAEISKRHGFKNIIAFDRFKMDTLFYSQLYPKKFLIDHRSGTMPL